MKTQERKTVQGKQRFAVSIDGDIREYFVHIPKAYNGNSSFPVVLMLHGSGGNGEKFYNISGWVQQGEAENIITVFPSSYKYDCVVDDGLQKRNAEKWTGYDLELCDNVKIRDDVKFLGKVIEQVCEKYNTDRKRIYMIGFSNGAEMAARCAVELSDKLAAVVACAGSLPPDSFLSPMRKIPVQVQIGAKDHNLLQKLGTSAPLPLDFPLLLATYPNFQSIIDSYLNSFGLNAHYVLLKDSERYEVARYSGNAGEPNIFDFVIVKGLDHNYPNGKNHPMQGAKVHWEWMKALYLEKKSKVMPAS